MFFPANSNRVRAQAAARPNTVFSGTTMAAVTRVSRSAESVAGSARLRRYTVAPLLKASMKTAASGTSSTRVMKPRAAVMSAIRTQAGSVRAALRAGAAAVIAPSRSGWNSAIAAG